MLSGVEYQHDKILIDATTHETKYQVGYGTRFQTPNNSISLHDYVSRYGFIK